MATTTTAILCPADEWTAVSDGEANVTVQVFAVAGNGPIGFRIAVAGSPPDNDVSDLGLVSTPANGGFAGKGLTAGTDNVYVRPLGGAGLAQVVAS